MTGTVRQPHFLQPPQRLLLRILPPHPLHQQRHGDILESGELGKQIMELPDETEFAAPKFRRIFLREPTQIELGEVYVTFGSPIKNSEDVQQGTLSCTRLAHDREHLAGLNLKRQIFKEHQFRLPRAEHFLEVFHP